MAAMRTPITIGIFILFFVLLSGCPLSNDVLKSNITVGVQVPIGPIGISFQKELSPEQINDVSKKLDFPSLRRDIGENSEFAVQVLVNYGKDSDKLDDANLAICWDSTFIEFMQPADLQTYSYLANENLNKLTCGIFNYGDLKPNLESQKVNLVGKTKNIGSLKYAGVVYVVQIEYSGKLITSTGENTIQISRI